MDIALFDIELLNLLEDLRSPEVVLPVKLNSNNPTERSTSPEVDLAERDPLTGDVAEKSISPDIVEMVEDPLMLETFTSPDVVVTFREFPLNCSRKSIFPEMELIDAELAVSPWIFPSPEVVCKENSPRFKDETLI